MPTRLFDSAPGERVTLRFAYDPRRAAVGVTVFDRLATEAGGEAVVMLMDTLTPASSESRAEFLQRLPADVREEVETILIAGAMQIAEDSRAPEPDEDAPTQGSAITFDEPEPSRSPVPTAALLPRLVETLNRYAVLPDGAALALALWVLLTYVVDAAFYLPKLALTSPLPRCGKTTVLTLLYHLVRRPLSAANLTPAVVFRVVEEHHPTLLIDEVDTFLGNRDEIVGILNAGHTRGTVVLRLVPVGDGYETRAFDVFTPQVLALIGRLPNAALADRCIVIPMRRKGAGERAERLRQDRIGALSEFRQVCLRWARDHIERLRVAEPREIDDLHDRAADNWRVMLAIADLAGESWSQAARRAAITLSGTADTEADGELLIGDLRRLFADTGATAMASADVVTALNALEERPWATWTKGMPLTPNGLARMLRNFDVRPRTNREGTSTFKGYRRADLEPVFARYLPSPPHTTVTAVTSAAANELEGRSTVTSENRVTDDEPRNVLGDNDVTAVTVAEGGDDPDDVEVPF